MVFKCPKCKNVINRKNKICNNCGYKVTNTDIKLNKMKNIKKHINERNDEAMTKNNYNINSDIESQNNPLINTEEITNNKENKQKDPIQEIDESNNLWINEKNKDKMKDNKKERIIITLFAFVSIILMLTVIFLGYKLYKNKKQKCVDKIEYIEREVSPNYKLINFEGYTYKIPLDFSFTSSDSSYKLINKDKTIYIVLSELDVGYTEFTSEEYQKTYIEKLQQEKNVLIKAASNKQIENMEYFLFEGTYDTYSYMIIVLRGNDEDSIFMIEAQFIDNVVLSSNRDTLINFALSYEKDI